MSAVVLLGGLALAGSLRLLDSDSTSLTTIGEPPTTSEATARDESVVRRSLPAVTRVHLGGGVNARLRTGSASELVATGATRDMEEVEIRIDGDALRVLRRHDEDAHEDERGPVTIDIEVDSLEEVEASAGARLVLHDLAATDVGLRAAGGASIEGDVRGDSAAVEASGGGSVQITGAFGTVVVEALGGGKVNLSSLAAASATARASGGGRIDIRVGERLESCSATGGGTVRYTQPRNGVGSVSTSSGGRCERL